MMELEPETHKKVLPALKAQTVGFFFWVFFLVFFNTPQSEWHSRGPCGNGGKDAEFFLIVK